MAICEVFEATKDPDSELDYLLDWADSSDPWLSDGDVINSFTATATGVTLADSSFTDTTTTAWVSGGTVGETATVLFHVTTAQGRVDDRTLYLHIRQR